MACFSLHWRLEGIRLRTRRFSVHAADAPRRNKADAIQPSTNPATDIGPTSPRPAGRAKVSAENKGVKTVVNQGNDLAKAPSTIPIATTTIPVDHRNTLTSSEGGPP